MIESALAGLNLFWPVRCLGGSAIVFERLGKLSFLLQAGSNFAGGQRRNPRIDERLVQLAQPLLDFASLLQPQAQFKAECVVLWLALAAALKDVHFEMIA